MPKRYNKYLLTGSKMFKEAKALLTGVRTDSSILDYNKAISIRPPLALGAAQKR